MLFSNPEVLSISKIIVASEVIRWDNQILARHFNRSGTKCRFGFVLLFGKEVDDYAFATFRVAKDGADLTDSEEVLIFGDAEDLWGETWGPGNFS
ncbi:MAG: hypothetical protein IH991_11120, partial [Planctomycetes bacterium]|nr:hypothetical protein [Planctomycetota bacterium]